MLKKNSAVEAANLVFAERSNFVIIKNDNGVHYVGTMKDAKKRGLENRVLPIGRYSPSEVNGKYIRIYELKTVPTEDGREVVWFQGFAENHEFFGAYNNEGDVEHMTVKNEAEYEDGNWVDAPCAESAALCTMILETIQHIAF